MKKILFLATAICLVFMTACTDSAKEAEPISSPEPPPVVAPTPEPTPTATPEPAPEPTPTIELPPVETTYNPKADLNSDGHVDKTEWEAWIKANPADKNQDMFISDEEKAPAKPTTPEKPAGNKPADTSKPSTPPESKPSTPPSTPAAPGGGNNGGERSEEERRQDAIDRATNGDTGGGGEGFEMPEGGFGGFDPVQ